MMIVKYTFPIERKILYAVKSANQNLIYNRKINYSILMNDWLPGAANPSDNQLIKWKILKKNEENILSKEKLSVYIPIILRDRGPKKSPIIPRTTAGRL
jgi:hypothetical protein